MAAVFLGRLKGMAGFEKLVAIKVIHPHLAREKSFVEMFLDEARLSAKIHHPNVVEVFEVACEDGLYFMVAELVGGKSLHHILQAAEHAQRRLDPRMYLTIVAKVCDALSAAHGLKAPDGSSLNLVHRDVSPTNILISYNGFIKLIDFGIAFARERITETRSGVVKGKYGYMAPEQLLGKPVDGRTDIFALGVVLYLLATGRHPFPGADEAEQIDRLLHLPLTAPREIVRDIEPELEKIILSALEKEPDCRPQNAVVLGKEIKQLMVPLGGLVDNTELADMMSDLFHGEIVEFKRIMEQATAVRPSSGNAVSGNAPNPTDMSRPPRKSGTSESLDTNTGHKKEPRGSVITELFNYLDSKTRWEWKKRLVILTGSICLALVAAIVYGAKSTDSFFDLVGLESADSIPLESIEKTGKQEESGEIANSILTHRDLEGHQSSEHTRSVKIVEMRIVGLPESAVVRLDGEETAIDNGKIAMPADGRLRELEVTAPGYSLFRKSIAPKDGGELHIELKKKRAANGKTVIHKVRNRKPEPDIMQCPYRDK